MRLVHFSSGSVDGIRPRDQHEPRPFAKPVGFWLSDEEAEQSWSTWCAGEGFRDTDKQIAHEITLAADHGLLHLACAADLLAFDAEFGVPDGYGRKAIDWQRVASHFPGIVITPYVWECRLEVDWYYGWDCASACIWDPSCIASINVGELALVAAPAGGRSGPASPFAHPAVNPSNPEGLNA